MALFFDAAWFDAKLAERALDRAALTAASGLDRQELHRVFTNVRAPTAVELNAFAQVLGVDIVEVTLRSGVAERDQHEGADAVARIESIESRLDAIDRWIEEFEQTRRRA
ncbi:MAG: hypothetical protein K2P58_15230 [Hyphomonadaceae bacterium]|nr:hypothetical protein [Hyphomonadaceae bacterium]